MVHSVAGGQNKVAGSQYTHRPTDVDSWIAQLRAVQARHPGEALQQFASDFAKAYKQVPAAPDISHLAVICQWSPKFKQAVFFLGRTQFFWEVMPC